MGWWREDLPFGKMIVFSMWESNVLKVIKEGYFFGSWNNYQKEVLYRENKSSLADNSGPHEQKGFIAKDVPVIMETIIKENLEMLKIALKDTANKGVR